VPFFCLGPVVGGNLVFFLLPASQFGYLFFV